MPTGLLRIDFNTNISSLNGRRLARQGPGNLLTNATRFLVNNRQLQDRDFIWVTPGPGTKPDILFVLDAGLQTESAVITGTAVEKAAKKKPKKPTKKAPKKAASKKSKKTAKKKSAKSTSKKRALRKGARKSSKK